MAIKKSELYSSIDFSKNRADHDDILGDAYEYLMQHFAQESGKSKGQFYTPSEVSRILAKVIGISPQNLVASTTAYDPTCGSGSLLLKVAAEAGKHITLEGQEKDVKSIVIHDKWLPNIQSAVKTEMERVSQQLTGRIKELIARYETPLPQLNEEVRALEEKVNAHLQKMGFVWN